MKRIITLLIFFVSFFANSQSFKTPSTPAFSILEYEPSAILRPSSYKEFSADILNSFDHEGKLLMNLGMEVSPYWLKSNPNLTREQFINPSTWQSISQTFTLSAATVKDSLTKSNNLGIGFRTQIIQGKVSKKYEEKYNELQQYETLIGVIESVRIALVSSGTLKNYEDVLQAIKRIGNEADLDESIINKSLEQAKLLKSKTNNTQDLEKFCFDISNAIDKSINQLTIEVIELQKKRTGFSLEVASAAKFNTKSDSKNSFEKVGLWVNANNYVSENDSFTLTVRIMSNANDSLKVNTDLGLGYLKEGKKYNFSLEALMRWYRVELPALNNLDEPITIIEKDFSYRLATQLTFLLSEKISFNMNFGKDFNDLKISGSSFFSIFGLQYYIFDKMNSVIK